MSDVGLGRADIDVRASVRLLDRDLREVERRTKRSVDGIQRDADRANTRLSRMGSGLRQNMDTTARSVRGVNAELRQSEQIATGLLAAIGGAAAATAIVTLADEYTNLSARIKLVLRDGESFAEVQDDIFRAAQRARAPVAELTTLYVRLRQSMADLSSVEALNISEVLAQSLTISGASVSEQASFLRQISQALASGVLRGDEFNSIMENNSRFARLLADHLGIGTGELRAMAEQGKLTADVIRDAIAGGASQINDEFSRMPLTIGGAMQQIRNAFARYVGETDSGLGASRRLADGLALLANNFESVANAILLVGGVMATSAGGKAIQRGLYLASRELRKADAGYRARRFGLRREQLSAAGTIAENADRTQQREEMIARRQADVEARRAEVAMRREQLAALNRNGDRAEIERAIRENRTPVFGGPAGGVAGATAQKNLEDATRRLAEAERELQGARARSRGEAVRDLQASNRLVWAKSELAKQNGVLAQSMRMAQAAGTVTTRVFGSLFSFLGGPWGVALAAATAGWMLFKSAQDRSAQSAATLQDALSIVANMTPAFENAATSIGETAAETETVAELSDAAAEATDRLAESQSRAADMARDQTDATRALAEMRRQDAIATMQQALAEERRRLATLKNYTATERVMDFLTGDFIGDRSGRRDPGAEVVAQSEAYVGILERGLAALEGGLGTVDGGGGGGGGGNGSGAGGASDLANLRQQAELRLAQINLEHERVAALEDALEIEQRTTAYVSAGLRAEQARAQATGEVRREREAMIAQQQESLRLSGLQEQADLARARDQHRIADALEDQLEVDRRIKQLRADGASEEEATRRANEYVAAQRAAAEAARNRSEAEAELQRMLEIAEAEGRVVESERLGRDLEIARRAADYRSRGYGDASENMAAADTDNLAAARLRGYAREAFSSALLAASTGGDWREALANSLQRAAEDGFSRAIDLVYDLLSSAVSAAFRSMSGGESDWFGTFTGAVVGGATGGGSIPTKANGGSIKPFQMYKGAEIGTEPIFLTNKPGQVITNRKMRDAMSQAGGGAAKVDLMVHAKTDGSVDLKIQAAKQEAIAAGAAAGVAQMAGAMRAGSSV